MLKSLSSIPITITCFVSDPLVAMEFQLQYLLDSVFMLITEGSYLRATLTLLPCGDLRYLMLEFIRIQRKRYIEATTTGAFESGSWNKQRRTIRDSVLDFTRWKLDSGLRTAHFLLHQPKPTT